MGTVIKRGTKWYVKWKDEAGKWRRQVCTAERKSEAEDLLKQLETQAYRRRKGLEEMPIEGGETLAELCAWWLDKKCSKHTVERERARLGKWIVRAPIGRLGGAMLRASEFEAVFDRMEEEFSAAPAAINKLRGTLLSVFKRARKAQRWAGANPISETEPRKVVKGVRPVITNEEVVPLLAQVPEQWRGFFAVAIYLALRKGEVCGLQKKDVNFKAGVVLISRSYDHQIGGVDVTKGENPNELPISPDLLPYLRAAMLASPSEYLFPGPEGKMRTEESDPHKILATALAKAGLIQGWRHYCRRCISRAKKAGGSGKDGAVTPAELAAIREKNSRMLSDDKLRRCAVKDCGMKLLAQPIPRYMRFHDLRHSTATILLRNGVPMEKVQLIMRHANIRTTAETYAHLNAEDLRSAVATIGPASPNPPSNPDSRGPTVVQGPGGTK